MLDPSSVVMPSSRKCKRLKAKGAKVNRTIHPINTIGPFDTPNLSTDGIKTATYRMPKTVARSANVIARCSSTPNSGKTNAAMKSNAAATKTRTIPSMYFALNAAS